MFNVATQRTLSLPSPTIDHTQ